MLVKNLKEKVIELYQAGHKISQISALVNLSRSTISKYLGEERIPIRNKKKLHLDKHDIEKAVELYAAGHSFSYIEEFTKLSQPTIHKYAKKAGIPLRRNWKRPDKHGIKKAIELYNKGFELSYIVKKANISTTTFWRYLKKEKIPLRKEEKNTIDSLKKEKIATLYQEGFSLKHIKESTKLNINSIMGCIKASGISRRSRGGVCIDKEKIEKAIRIYKEGHSLQSSAQEVKISSATLSRYLKKRRIPIRGKGGRRDIDKKKIQEALELYKEGHSIKSSAEKVKISPITLCKYLKKAEIPIRRNGNFVDKKKLKEALALYKSGHTFRSAGKITGIHESTISKYIKAAGIPVRKKKVIREEDIEKAGNLYKKGNSLRICAESINISSVTLLKYFKAEGIYIKQRGNKEKVERAIELYRNGWLIKDIVQSTNLSPYTIARYVKESGIPRREKGWQPIDSMKLEKAIEIYKEGYSIQNSAQKAKISPITLFKYLKKRGIPRRRAGARPIDGVKLEKAIESYKEGCSLQSSAQKININAVTLSKYLKKTGILVRRTGDRSIDSMKLEETKRLYKKESSVKESAQSIKINPKTLSKYIKKTGRPGRKRTINKDDLDKVLKLYMDGYPLKYIKEITGLSNGSITRHIKLSGVPMRGSQGIKIDSEKIAEALELYKSGLGFYSIEKIVNISAGTIWNYAKAAGIPIRKKKGKPVDKEKIEKALELYKEGYTLQYSADAVKINRGTLAGYLYKTKIPKRRIRQSPEEKRTTVENILRLYKEGATYHNISQSTNTSMSTVYKHVREAGVVVTRKRVFNKERLEKAIELYKKDYEISDIEKITSISKSSILKYAKIAKIPRRKKSSTRISKEKIEQILKLYEEGHKLSYISDVKKISQASIVKYAKGAGLPPRELKGPRVSGEKIEKALQLYKEGYSLSYIRDSINISKGSISKYVKIRGLPMRGKIKS